MIEWHHRLSGHEFKQAPGDSKGQGSLACRHPWGVRVGHDLAVEHTTHKIRISQKRWDSTSIFGYKKTVLLSWVLSLGPLILGETSCPEKWP